MNYSLESAENDQSRAVPRHAPCSRRLRPRGRGQRLRRPGAALAACRVLLLGRCRCDRGPHVALVAAPQPVRGGRVIL